MPAVSGKQYRAMQAAAHGHSTLGIPASVGKEFVASGPPKGKSIEQEVKTRRLHGLKRRLEEKNP
jgi:hypothetical protein